MRDVFLVVAIAVGLGFTLRYPFVGVLIWEWLSLMSPQQEAYGFARTLPINLIVATFTIGSLLLRGELRRIPLHPVIVTMGIFLAWATFNSFFAFDPSWSWPIWDRVWKIFALGFVVAATARSRVRIEAVIWIAIVSLGYYGIKGGIFTLLTGGGFKVYGPESSIISDNNQLALALLMSIPLFEFLRRNVTSKSIALLLLGSIATEVIAILGSYSRGAYVAMAAVALFALLRTERRIVYITVLFAIIIPALYFMPDSFYVRLNSINSFDTDSSFQGRVVAWKVAYRYASDHFPFGAGFYGPQLAGIFNRYFPFETRHAAHSIYFQVLGEHGYIGFIIYVCVALLALRSCSKIVRRAKQQISWASDLAKMIQISLIAFLVGGAALSMAYYDLFIISICLLPQLDLISLQVKPLSTGWKNNDMTTSTDLGQVVEAIQS